MNNATKALDGRKYRIVWTNPQTSTTEETMTLREVNECGEFEVHEVRRIACLTKYDDTAIIGDAYSGATVTLLDDGGVELRKA